MHNALRIAAFALVAGCPAISMTKCVDIEYAVTVYPDASGKFAITLTTPSPDTPDPPEKQLADTLKITTQSEGFAAWATPTFKPEGKNLQTVLTGYFEDISKVRWYDGDPPPTRKLLISFDLSKTSAGQTLVARDKVLGQMIEDAARPLKPDEKAGTLDDHYWITITVPGRIVKSEGIPKPDGRSASIRLDQRLVAAAREGKEEARKAFVGLSDEIKVTSSGSEVTPAELEAFKTEFAAAKETWKTLKGKVPKNAKD